MSKSDTHSFDSSKDHHFSPEEQAILRANQADLDYFTGTTETEGLIQDNKRVLQGLQNDFKKIIGNNINNLLLILLLLFCIGVYNDLNWHPYSVAQGSAGARDKITASNLINTDLNKTSGPAKQYLITNQRRNAKISSSGLIDSKKQVLDLNHTNSILFGSNDPVSVLPTNNRMGKVESLLIKSGNNQVKYLIVISDIESMALAQSPSSVCKITAFRKFNSSADFAIKCQLIFNSIQAKNDLEEYYSESSRPPVIGIFNSIFKDEHQLPERP